MSLKFGGATTDKVTVAEKSTHVNLDPCTIMAWILPTAIAVNDLHVFSKGITTVKRRLFLVGASLVPKIEVRRAGGVASCVGSALALNKWHFLAATWGLTDGPNMYVGTEAMPEKLVSASIDAGSGTLTSDAGTDIIWGGTADAAFGDSFIGLIAAVGYWNRALPLNEIRAQQMHFQPTRGNVDFHVFRQSGRNERQEDLSRNRTSSVGVITGTTLNVATSPKVLSEPAAEIY